MWIPCIDIAVSSVTRAGNRYGLDYHEKPDVRSQAALPTVGSSSFGRSTWKEGSRDSAASVRAAGCPLCRGNRVGIGGADVGGVAGPMCGVYRRI